MPMLLGLLGLSMVALALGLYLGRCNSFGLFPLVLTGYIAGAALLGGGLIFRYRPGVAMSVLVLLGVAALAFLVGFLAFAASFARCYEF
ncbi:hypothetical protein [Nonomuraea guangzhouensis]|uniref:Uncharacterized protein n=1 Tax=Nonomuraea guangzhouensis TaxID=1291555 RepID=A0ABW4GVM2_9ACTN|nr:hypothetical protein [Nonomuraea guangzhouensis]